MPDPDRPGCVALRVGMADQSYVDVTDPLHLEFDYMARMGDAITHWRRPPTPVRATHVGGGALTLPRWVAATRPGSSQIVFEPDAEVVELVRRELPLRPGVKVRVRPQPGREGLAALADASADLLISDVFVEGRVPGEYATVEYAAELARVRAGGGLVLWNVVDRAPFTWARAVVAGVATLFPQVSVGAASAVWKGRRAGNLILAASEDLPVAALQRGAGVAFPYRWLAPHQIGDWTGGATPRTDASPEPSPDLHSTGTWLA